MKLISVVILLMSTPSAFARERVDLIDEGLVEVRSIQLRTASGSRLTCEDNALMFYGLFSPKPGIKYVLDLPSCLSEKDRGFYLHGLVAIAGDDGEIGTSATKTRATGIRITFEDRKTGKVVNLRKSTECKTRNTVALKNLPKNLRMVVSASSAARKYLEFYGVSTSTSHLRDLCFD